MCNASTEDVVSKKGTLVSTVTVVPKSAFDSEDGRKNFKTCVSSSITNPACSFTKSLDTNGVLSVPGATPNFGKTVEPIPERDKTLREELDPDFSNSKLSDEHSFADLFVESSLKPGRTDLLEFSIDTGDHTPIKSRPYRVSKAEGDVMEAEIQQYLDKGFVRPSLSPWASPVLMIRKPDGGIRSCVVYRRLNTVIIKDCYPMPLIDDILNVLGNDILFSTMDVASGYWNVPMAADSVEKTAFTCKYGLYEWLVMPFGLCNAVPAFERLMENVLIDQKWRTCLVFLDDCVVFSEDFPTHLVRLRQVLERFRKASFKLKMKKGKWGRDQKAFLGHIVTPSGILPNPEKVKALMNVKRPHDIHTVQTFLGLSSNFRR
ncbi:hypothetical protein PHMEG_00029131 [Phytophthora megakarya]|uniref:Reverse transcriptase domain-containing protein n=1 Tax=Phytophthora megakarya TaxID=4795 RepID=A0A225V4E8_9STRA|nr:hypothetical protein PHMEG_00029131 [Phytophthora megakarya]